tara:strand:- start:8041 stop:11373 length:3333 start_codon:yes stop_codon:yes gene_type:complete
MSSKLELLKKKPVPQKRLPVHIEIAKKRKIVNIDVTVKDMRNETDSDEIGLKRAKMMEKLRMVPPRPLDELPKTVPKATEKPRMGKTISKDKKTRRRVLSIGKKVNVEPLKGTVTQSARLTEDPKLRNEMLETMVEINDEEIMARLPEEKEDVLIKSSQYFMNNREFFSTFINNLFLPYREEFMDEDNPVTCDTIYGDKTGVSLMTHQKLVRDYLNNYTPYRGLLLYHGLGSGKTCSSIAIAEGMKSKKKVIIMTPASLRMNYIEEIKKCGDDLYRKNQFWEFISISENPEYVDTLSLVLSLSKDFIIRNKGAWLVNVTKPPNYESLSAEQARNLESQLDQMISNKYEFINYNGMRLGILESMTEGFKKNPFDNSVIIIDEAHNFVSRIVNKLKKEESLSMRLYEYLLSASNAKIVLLTGTPVINYPNEIAILFNILRGYITTWEFTLLVKGEGKVDEKAIKNMLSEIRTLDFIEFKPATKKLIVTRNPFGFFNASDKESRSYSGVNVNDGEQMNNRQFENYMVDLLKKNGIEIVKQNTKITNYKALPDDLDGFRSKFINVTKGRGDLKNTNLFKKRILGLTSYYRSAQEGLMPEYDKDKDFHVVKVPMSDYQFGIYEQARVEERKLEKNEKKKKPGKKKGKGKGDDIYSDTVSTYRIFSRAFCNFVFPKTIARPLPRDADEVTSDAIKEMDEDAIDAKSVGEKMDNPDGVYTIEDKEKLQDKEEEGDVESYSERITNAMKKLKDNSDSFLTKDQLQVYSPKFLHILESLQDEKNEGLHMLYTQFRTLEGIGVFKLVLEQNGFAQFKIKYEREQWKLDIPLEDRGKPMFALYTGTETQEEKEIIRNIFNSTWQYIPRPLAEELEKISKNNYYGEIIKLLMITSSGAEGITLQNVRYVHVVEPYWHPARTEQVVGRARRICSHKNLPKRHQTVEVFLYLMEFTSEQLASEQSVELRLKDKSKYDKVTPVTSDETLYEISSIKEEINHQLLVAVKESSIDCAVYSKSGSSEPLVCYSVGRANKNTFSYKPSVDKEEIDRVDRGNKEEITWKVRVIKQGAKRYVLRIGTTEVYDYDSYIQALETKEGNPLLKGRLVKKEVDGKKKYIIEPVKL